nr:hypothetical protein [Heyndrickxia coagulans]
MAVKAVTFQGAKDIQVKEVDDPSLKKCLLQN